MRRLPASAAGLLLFGSLLSGLAQPVQASNLPGWLSSLDEAKKASAATSKPILVDLYADWCGWCKQLERQVYATPRFQEYATKLVLLRVDVEDGAEGSWLQSRFEAFSLPTTLLVSSDLVQVGRVNGFLPAEDYIRSIDQQLVLYRDLMTRYERQKDSDDIRTVQQLAAELYERGDGRRSASLWNRLLENGKVPPAVLGQFHYRLADAWRLAGEYARANQSVAVAQREASARSDQRLSEACDVMAFRIARESGECKRAIEAIQTFLKQYPASEYKAWARQNLKELQSKPTCGV